MCQLKYGDGADQWLREGFSVAKRIDSTKRHFDESHKRERAEDAIAHLAHSRPLPLTPNCKYAQTFTVDVCVYHYCFYIKG